MFAPSRSEMPTVRATGPLGAAGVLMIGMLALMQSLPPAVPEFFLRGRFFGALSLTADWSGPDLIYDGMQRPDGKGVRLFFARNQPGGARVSVLIGIDGRPEELVGAERPANVTVIDGKQSRFFSAGGPGRCWASIKSVTALNQGSRGHAGYRIDGLVYCVGALPSLRDRSSLTLSELQFAGRVTTGEV